MRVLLLLSLAFLMLGFVHGDANSEEQDWQSFKSKFKKAFKTATEEGMRFKIWLKNSLYMKEHNRNVSSLTAGSATERGYYLAENHLMDLTDEEYKKLLGFRPTASKPSSNADMTRSYGGLYYKNTVPVSQLPTTVNWTAQGYVNPVENQGQCGDCWAFSAAGALEGMYYNATRTSAILSEQNLLDCSSNPTYGNEGCNGGSMIAAFEYVAANKGIDTYNSYPYTGVLGTCRYSSSNSVGYATGYKIVEPYSEPALQQAVALIGPISVGINAGLPDFQLYRTGVYDPSGCSGSVSDIDHAVLAVGYGTYKGQDYWLLKNSWGTNWGIQGYMMMARNANNMCGIATDASFPTGFVTSGLTFSDQGVADSPGNSASMLAGQSLFFLIALYLTLSSQLPSVLF